MLTVRWVSGVWVTATEGRTWCSAKGPTLLDLSKICISAILPKKMRTIEYCSRGRGCKHELPAGFSVFHSKIQMAPENMLSETKVRDSNRGRGKGAKGGGHAQVYFSEAVGVVSAPSQ